MVIPFVITTENIKTINRRPVKVEIKLDNNTLLNLSFKSREYPIEYEEINTIMGTK